MFNMQAQTPICIVKNNLFYKHTIFCQHFSITPDNAKRFHV